MLKREIVIGEHDSFDTLKKMRLVESLPANEIVKEIFDDVQSIRSQLIDLESKIQILHSKIESTQTTNNKGE